MTFIEKMKVVFSGLWVWLQPIVMVLLKQGGDILLKMALDAVKITADGMSGATDNQKRDAAYSLILNNAKSAGITATTSAINLAIEMAVQKLKER